MRIDSRNRYVETKRGSGIYRDLLSDGIIQSTSSKALRQYAKDPNNRKMAVKLVRDNVPDGTLDRIQSELSKRVPIKDRYVDDVVQTGKKSLKSALKKNLGNAMDESGNIRPGVSDMLNDPDVVRSIPKKVFTEATKKAKKQQPTLSTLLGQSLQKRGAGSTMVKHRGTGSGGGLTPFGMGVAYI